MAGRTGKIGRYSAPSPKLWNGQTRPLWSWGVRFAFGKYEGRTIREVSETREGEEYLRWIAGNFEDGYIKAAVEHFFRSRRDMRRRERRKAKDAAVEVAGLPRWTPEPPKPPRITTVPRPEPGVTAPFEGGLRFMGAPITRDGLAALIGEQHVRTILGVPR